jgi:hypothetical protein
MRRSLLLLIPLLGLSTAGCDMLVNFTRNVAYEIARCSDETIECYRFRKEAAAAWEEAEARCEEPFSADFARGFKQGYAEYLAAGGNGEPPPAPPCGYWMTKGRLSEYFQAVQEWSNGYRTGAATARAKGARLPGIMPTATPGPGGAWPPEFNGWPGWIGDCRPTTPEPLPLPLPQTPSERPIPAPRQEVNRTVGPEPAVPSVFAGRIRR